MASSCPRPGSGRASQDRLRAALGDPRLPLWLPPTSHARQKFQTSEACTRVGIQQALNVGLCCHRQGKGEPCRRLWWSWPRSRHRCLAGAFPPAAVRAPHQQGAHAAAAVSTRALGGQAHCPRAAVFSEQVSAGGLKHSVNRAANRRGSSGLCCCGDSTGRAGSMAGQPAVAAP